MTRAFSSTGMGLFEGGQVEGILPTMGDIFGFSDLAQAAAAAAAASPQVKLTGSPALDALNVQDMAAAKAALAEYNTLISRIPYISDPAKKAEIQTLVDQKYAGGGFLKASKYNLKDVATVVQNVVNSGGQFYAYKGLTEVNDRFHGYLDDLKTGLKTLRTAMGAFIVLPPEKTTQQVMVESGIHPADLWAQAQAAAVKARQTKNPADIGAAYALAEAVQGEGTYSEDAVALMAEMEALGSSVGTSAKEVAHKASASEGVGKAAGLSTIQMALIGGGAIALVAGIIWFTRK
jgi:hypothetical protein